MKWEGICVVKNGIRLGKTEAEWAIFNYIIPGSSWVHGSQTLYYNVIRT